MIDDAAEWFAETVVAPFMHASVRIATPILVTAVREAISEALPE